MCGFLTLANHRNFGKTRKRARLWLLERKSAMGMDVPFGHALDTFLPHIKCLALLLFSFLFRLMLMLSIPVLTIFSPLNSCHVLPVLIPILFQPGLGSLILSLRPSPFHLTSALYFTHRSHPYCRYHFEFPHAPSSVLIPHSTTSTSVFSRHFQSNPSLKINVPYERSLSY